MHWRCIRRSHMDSRRHKHLEAGARKQAHSMNMTVSPPRHALVKTATGATKRPPRAQAVRFATVVTQNKDAHKLVSPSQQLNKPLDMISPEWMYLKKANAPSQPWPGDGTVLRQHSSCLGVRH